MNCQHGVGAFERFRFEPQADGTFAIASVENFPVVFLRMDGTGVTAFNPAGGGAVNCQHSVGAFERFNLTSV